MKSFFIHVVLNFILNLLCFARYISIFRLFNPNWITTIIYMQANKSPYDFYCKRESAINK